MKTSKLIRRDADDLSAYILLNVKPGTENRVIENLKKLKETITANVLYGEWDVIAGIKVDDIKYLDGLIIEKIRKIQGVKMTSTMIVAK